MRITSSVLMTALLLASSRLLAADVLLTNVVVYDGTGSEPLRGDVRIEGERIVAIAPHLQPKNGEAVVDQRGLALAPGFIDMHSHGDGDLVDDLDAAAVSRQGVTTILGGQDGESKFPLRDYFAGLSTNPPAINLASMAGHSSSFNSLLVAWSMIFAFSHFRSFWTVLKTIPDCPKNNPQQKTHLSVGLLLG